MSEKNPENLSDTWLNQKNNPISFYCRDQPQYLSLFHEHFKEFSGTILEIGPGNGYLCKHIVSFYDDVEYSILDTEKNTNELKQKYLTKKQIENIEFINSSEYKKVFLKKYDLLISTFCLPETPEYYWRDILDNIRVNNCFIIDDGKWCNYEDYRNQWLCTNFDSCDETKLVYTITGYEKKGIQLTIGKNKNKGVD